ncbi:MAG: class I SAM-dependent methyltransferase [Chloroflexota bacterium]
MLNPNSLRALLTPAGEEILQTAAHLRPKEEAFLTHYQQLSRLYPPDLARAALEIAILRQKAQAKFPFAERMFLTPEALEQASPWEVSQYRARRYQGFERVLDLGCSIGADTLALGGVTSVVGIDKDALRLMMARLNLAALGLEERCGFVQADLLQPLPIPKRMPSLALFFDPARRQDKRRIYHVDAYQPPLGVLHNWIGDYPQLGVKISPGVKLEEIGGYDCEVEFISLAGELKEAVLWFGSLRTARRRATILPAGVTLSAELWGSADQPLVGLSPPLDYILEPDPAVIRAGLVQSLAQQLDAFQLDREIAYLTTSCPIASPFARCWQVEAWMPFHLKRLREVLRARSVGNVTVKKRGSPLEPDDLRRQLRLQGEQERVLFLTRWNGAPIVVIALPAG